MQIKNVKQYINIITYSTLYKFQLFKVKQNIFNFKTI